jgi:exodeoxyribonuclease V gamma subunit
MLILHHSNRLERLADALAETLREPLASPLDREVIAVQSTGMARWLSMALAGRLGISASVRFPFPARLVWEIFRALVPDVPERSPYSREVMTWRLMGLLPEVFGKSGFEPLRAYLREEDDLRRYQLAGRIADLFDQYLVYRPDWITRWELGEDDVWHAHLWRILAASGGRDHRVNIQKDALAALGAGRVAAGLPPRISLFSISTLPPAELEVFARLADSLDVHLFLLNPCLHFWTEIRSERDIARQVKDQDPRRLYLETGNSLLASLGKQGQDFLRLLQDYDFDEEEAFEEPDEDGLLHCVQSDILTLRNLGEDPAARRLVNPEDRSIQVHSCHSPMREIEVLHDQLLALFEADPALEPGDVAVMTPDVEGYAPVIEAVFGTAESGRNIPFSIADRRRRAESPVANAFLALLEVFEGRFGAEQVLALLEAEAVRQRFGIAEGDLAQIRDWVREVGVRWGADAEDRRTLGLPATPEHTWRAGLDRLLLGYALPGEGRSLYAGILPYDEVEGAAGRVVGRLCAFVETLFALREEMGRARPLEAWVTTLVGVLRGCMDAGEDEEGEVAAIRLAIVNLGEDATRAGFAGPVSLAVARAALQTSVEAGQGGGRFLTGRVTFCAMVPMRSLPFKLVCLVGMNDGSYPRSRRAPGFDLMSQEARPGDRSRRDDDRYLFLEAILSARDVLYLSYVGQSVRDNSPLPPSVLVSDLLDYVDRGFVSAEDAEVLRDCIVTRHPLHAFSPRYFGRDVRLFSFSEELCEASRQRRRVPGTEVPFIAAPLPEPGPELRTVDLGRLIRFFQHPIKHFVRERLRIHLDEQEEIVESREPFVLEGLGAYGLRQDLLDLALAGCPPAEALPIIRAGGRLPEGRVGEMHFAEQAERVVAFVRELERHLPADRLEPIPVDLGLGPVRLVGWLSGVSAQGLLDYRPTTPKPKDWIALWLRHLLLNALRPAGIARTSVWLGDGEAIQLRPVDDAGSHLARMAAAYWEGLRRPLPLFPRTSFAFAERLHRTQDEARARETAQSVWCGNDYQQGECVDAYHQLALRGREPLDHDFERLARELFLPMLEHRQ